MQYKSLGRTGYEVSTVSFGAWAIGGTWGDVDDAEAMRCLHRALDLGVNFFDTADVYGDGHSERLLARLRRERKDPFWVATKVGRRSSPHVAASYNRANLTAYGDRDFKGGKSSLGLGIFEDARGGLGGAGNDDISSLKVAPGHRAVACEHGTKTTVFDVGLCRYYPAGDVAYVGADINDLITLVAVDEAASAPAKR